MRFYPVPARKGIYTVSAPSKTKQAAKTSTTQAQLSNQQAQQIIDLFEPVIR